MAKFDTLYITVPDKFTYKQICRRLDELKFDLGLMESTTDEIGYVYVSTDKSNIVSYSGSNGNNPYLNMDENGIQGTLVTLYTKEFVDKFKP